MKDLKMYHMFQYISKDVKFTGKKQISNAIFNLRINQKNLKLSYIRPRTKFWNDF